MKKLIVKAGDVVVTEMGFYQHWSIVTGEVCPNGTPMLISATQRNGTVLEEPWQIVTHGKETYVVDFARPQTTPQFLARARSKIGEWPYSVSSMNCEKFVKWAAGLQPTSRQVTSGIGAAAVATAVTITVSKNPSAYKILGIAALAGGIGVLAARAPKKLESEDV